jgi:hypothetical protein
MIAQCALQSICCILVACALDKELPMTEKTDPKWLVNYGEILKSNSSQLDALCQLLIEKGIITHDEFFDKLSEVQLEGHLRTLIK